MGLDDNVRENLLRKLQASAGTSQPGEREGQSGPGRGQGIGSEADRAHARQYSQRDTLVICHGLTLHGKKFCVCLQMHDITTELFRAWRHRELTYYRK